ncbi:MAG TPA: hypothetical protein VGP04_02575 [Pseudonocardiaceae bacterium]|jgi:hypothetical protein|nr:hypothetical protein [Pseudonocardiaceae bacterium]
MLTASPPPCTVLHCPDEPSDLWDELHIEGSDGTCAMYLCANHKDRIDQGESWLWVPWNRLKGVGSDMSEGCILMGEKLAGFGLVVGADVRISTSLIFSPDRAEGRETTTLAIDGRLYGANQHVSLELVLNSETVARLKETLRFLRP